MTCEQNFAIQQFLRLGTVTGFLLMSYEDPRRQICNTYAAIRRRGDDAGAPREADHPQKGARPAAPCHPSFQGRGARVWRVPLVLLLQSQGRPAPAPEKWVQDQLKVLSLRTAKSHGVLGRRGKRREC